MKTKNDYIANWVLGDLEPINKAQRESTPDRRQISVRWLAGSVLAGLTSLILMGGALFAALDGSQKPISAAGLFLPNNSLFSNNSNDPDVVKGHRVLLNHDTPDSPSNIMMVSTISRENDRDVVKQRPFLMVNAPLAIAPSRKVEYPRFNPLTVFSVASKAEIISKSSDFIYGADVESEVSIKVSPFPHGNGKIVFAARQRTVDIENLVRRAGPGLEGDTTSIGSSSQIDPDRFSVSDNQPFLTTPGVIITAENVSVKNMINPDEYAGIRFEDRILKVRSELGIAAILKTEGMDDEATKEVETILSADLGNRDLQSGDKIRLAYRIAGDADTVSIARISVYRGITHVVTVARSDQGKFVYSREPSRLPQLALGPKRRPTVSSKRLPSVYDGVNKAAYSEGLTGELAKILVRVFAFDVDFRKKITPSDELKAIVSLEDGQTEPGPNSEILFTSIKLDNITRKYYRFRDSETGRIDYYDETGKSAKKFLLRKPVPNSRFGSKYGFRRHPISRIRKMHWGVDWTAPRGTPIIAAGNGTVEKAGWSGGYGKKTVVKHANGYKTYYNHQTAFAKGIVPGARVRQGQIIGYVGSTGYSTGPHLHYEVSVNGSKVDPMRIRLPKGKILKDEELSLFEAERDRIDALLNKRESEGNRLALN